MIVGIADGKGHKGHHHAQEDDGNGAPQVSFLQDFHQHVIGLHVESLPELNELRKDAIGEKEHQKGKKVDCRHAQEKEALPGLTVIELSQPGNKREHGRCIRVARRLLVARWSY